MMSQAETIVFHSLHARTLQIVFAIAHFVVLGTYFQPALDLANSGEFSAVFFVPALLLSLLVVTGCVPSGARLVQTNLYLATNVLLGTLCLLAWASPIVMLFVASALAAAWCACIGNTPRLMAGGVILLVATMAVLVYACSRIPVDAWVAASARDAARIQAGSDAQDLGRPAANGGVSAQTAVDTAQAVSPAVAQSLPQLELGETILLFMPSTPMGSLAWDFNADGPIAWETSGYATQEDPMRSFRNGLMRVHVLGTLSTVLRQARNELAWAVRYISTSNPKFGPESIELAPGIGEEGGCFGTLFDGCAFDPRPSLQRAGIAVETLCSSPNEANGATVFSLSYPGHVTTLLKWHYSTGSGGQSSSLEMRVVGNGDALKCE